MASEEKAIKVIEFTGTDFKIWSKKFVARANRKGYKGLLEGTEPIPTKSEYSVAESESNETQKKTRRAYKLNELAYEDILLSINCSTSSGKTAFNLVDNCVTKDQPDGNCKLAWERLTSKYQPRSTPSYIQLKKDFANSKLSSLDTRPDEWMSELESFRTEMNKIEIRGKTEMSEVDLIIHILSNLPEEYEVAVSELERKLKDDSIQLKMEDIRETLSSRYERIAKNDKAREEEVAFMAFKKQFKGMCKKCGEYGHKSQDCPKHKTGRDQKKFRGKCWYCGEEGHTAFHCEKRKSDEKREKNGERAMFASGKQSRNIEDYISEDESYTCELGL